jgi:NAD(P)-dependent dehydrogenase (short-subunit alcohol dehydrogenase family)
MLEGKVAIVTGAGRGLGRAHALELASHGARLVVNDLGVSGDGQRTAESPADEVAAEIVGAGGEAVANHEDVSTWEGAQQLVAHAVAAFGRLDVLVNNAAILRDRMIFNMTEEEWDDVIRVDAKGHFAPTRFACTYWREQSKETGGPVGGRIIHTASESGLYGNPGQVNYAFAKAGIIALSLVAAREMARFGVTSNVICPRARTRLADTSAASPAPPTESPSAEWDPRDPANVSPLVALLASDRGANVSGQVFAAVGGAIQLIDQAQGGQVRFRDARWTVDELAAELPSLFGARAATPVDPVFPTLLPPEPR